MEHSFVVFDTETTGLPSSYGVANVDNYNKWDSCRMVQLAWEIYKSPDDAVPISYQCYLVKPNGFVIPPKATSIHGISTDHALKYGLSISNVINLFMEDIEKHNVTTAVAHNMKFDQNVLVSEMIRASIDQTKWETLRKHCTMIAGTIRGKPWPKLSALYITLIGPIPESSELHRADVDAHLCGQIYKVQAQTHAG